MHNILPIQYSMYNNKLYYSEKRSGMSKPLAALGVAF